MAGINIEAVGIILIVLIVVGGIGLAFGLLVIAGYGPWSDDRGRNVPPAPPTA